jgi:hypothetical protein
LLVGVVGVVVVAVAAAAAAAVAAAVVVAVVVDEYDAAVAIAEFEGMLVHEVT